MTARSRQKKKRRNYSCTIFEYDAMNKEKLKKNTKEETCKSEKYCSPCQNGTKNLLIGAGFGAYGTTIALTAGTVCPVCIIATPLFLGIGAYQKIKHLKRKKEYQAETPQERT